MCKQFNLFSGKMKFDPSLPSMKRELLKRMPMANYVKMVFNYKTVCLIV